MPIKDGAAAEQGAGSDRDAPERPCTNDSVIEMSKSSSATMTLFPQFAEPGRMRIVPRKQVRFTGACDTQEVPCR